MEDAITFQLFLSAKRAEPLTQLLAVLPFVFFAMEDGNINLIPYPHDVARVFVTMA